MASLLVTICGLPGKCHARIAAAITPMASICACRWLIQCDAANSVVHVLLWDIGLRTGAFEAPVGVLAIVEGHAMDTQDMGLQVALLGGTVGAVTAPERSLAWRKTETNNITFIRRYTRLRSHHWISLCTTTNIFLH